jgi:hypothetical protein
VTANERQMEAGRAWARKLPKPAQGSRDAWARFEEREEIVEQEQDREAGR